MGERDDWHAIHGVVALERLEVTSKEGLSEPEVKARREKFGNNELEQIKPRSAANIIFHQVFNGLTAILLGVFIIAVVNKEWIEAVVVMLVITLNSSIASYQEISSERALAAIRGLASASLSRVVRDGQVLELPAIELVLGDIVELRQGSQVTKKRKNKEKLLFVDRSVFSSLVLLLLSSFS